RGDGLYGRVRPEDGDRVVQGDEPDRPTRPRTAEGRPKRRLHAGDAAFDLKPRALEDVAEVARAFVLLVGELGMLVHVTMGVECRLPLRLDRRQDLVVHDYLLDRRNTERHRAPSMRRRPRTGAGATCWSAEAASAVVSASFVAMHRANCSVRLPATSATTPRPYCATAPRRAKSVAM